MRFDDNVSFIDADADYGNTENRNTKTEIIDSEDGMICDTAIKMANDEMTTKTHECYGYDNVTVISDDLATISQRAIKVCFLKYTLPMLVTNLYLL